MPRPGRRPRLRRAGGRRWLPFAVAAAVPAGAELRGDEASEPRRRNVEACEARLGLANWTQRPDLPSPEQVQRALRTPYSALRAFPGYSRISLGDFNVFRSEAGFVALPRDDVRLPLEIENPASDDSAMIPFLLESLQFRLNSEHKVDGKQFHGELQLVHRNRFGMAVTIAMLLDGLPRYKTVLYPRECPDLYSPIESASQCQQAAIQTKLAEGKDVAVRLRKFKSAHDVPGCFAAIPHGGKKYSIVLDPEIFALSVHWGHTYRLCKTDTLITDWALEFTAGASDLQLAVRCSTWFGWWWDSRCAAATLHLDEVFGGTVPVLRYDGGITRMKTLEKGSGRFTFRLHPSSGLGLSLDYAEDRPLTVKSIDPHGQIAAWNRDHPEQRVEVGDRIVAVDGRFASVPELVDALRQDRDLEVTIDWTEVPQCASPLEWLIYPRPLPVDLLDLQKVVNMTSALPELIGSRKALKEVHALEEEAEMSEVFKPSPRKANHTGIVRGSSMEEVDLGTLMPPEHSDFGLPLISALQSSGFYMFAAALSVAAFIAWGLMSWQGQYEPDLVETTRRACWPLVRMHSVACAAAWASVPLLFAGRKIMDEAKNDWEMPKSSGVYMGLAIFAQLLVELWYVETAGSARLRVPLAKALELLAFDALSILDLYLTLLFFCISYNCRSKLCWGALWAFLMGRLVAQWLLGAVLAAIASDEALLHWQPRQMGFMHAVVLRQLLSMQRDDQVRVRCAWVALPLLKCVLEDVPCLLFQVAFFRSHQVAHHWVGLSAFTSAAVAVRGAYLTVEQAREADVSRDEVVAALRAHLHRLDPRSETARECPGTNRAFIGGDKEHADALDHE